MMRTGIRPECSACRPSHSDLCLGVSGCSPSNKATRKAELGGTIPIPSAPAPELLALKWTLLDSRVHFNKKAPAQHILTDCDLEYEADRDRATRPYS